MSCRRTAGPDHLFRERLPAVQHEFPADHDGDNAGCCCRPVQQTFLRLSLSAGNSTGPADENTQVLEHKRYHRQKRFCSRLCPENRQIRTGILDFLHDGYGQRTFLQESGPVLCRSYRIPGGNHSMDVHSDRLPADSRRSVHKHVLVQISLSARGGFEFPQVLDMDHRPLRSLVGAGPAWCEYPLVGASGAFLHSRISA